MDGTRTKLFFNITDLWIISLTGLIKNLFCSFARVFLSDNEPSHSLANLCLVLWLKSKGKNLVSDCGFHSMQEP